MSLPTETPEVLPPEDCQYPADSYNVSHDTEYDIESKDHDKNTPPTPESSALHPGIGGSLTWVSEDTKERDNFRKMRSNIGFVAPKSPFIPANMNEWLTHRMEMLAGATKELDRLIEKKKEQQASSCNVKIQPALAGGEIKDFRSTVLARRTIWRPDEVKNPSRPQAPWPDSSERKHEGYQRVRSGYSRFPPLPRVPGNATVNWKQRSPVTPYEFDLVGRPVAMNEENTDTDQSTETAIGLSLLREIEE